jgi:hypothetical protein
MVKNIQLEEAREQRLTPTSCEQVGILLAMCFTDDNYKIMHLNDDVDSKMVKIRQYVDTFFLVRFQVTIYGVSNHIFTILNYDEDNLLLLQGFQNYYNIQEWMANRNYGKLSKMDFFKHFTNVLSGTNDDLVSLRFLFDKNYQNVEVTNQDLISSKGKKVELISPITIVKLIDM